MSNNNIKAIRGFSDLLPEDSPLWGDIEANMRAILARWNYSEVRTPIVEKTELFCRGIGEATDIVGKEMYTFQDKGDESLTLRPEGTAGVVRAFVEHNLHTASSPVKLWYTGPMFRYERPQKGRYRQFHQLGVEVFGETSALVDAEVVALGYELLRAIGIHEAVAVEINNIGCPECRPGYRDALTAYLKERIAHLCENCVSRLDKNPLRSLDCKATGCREQVKDAPRIDDHRCPACADHYSALQHYLEIAGVPFQRNSLMVRGLDYYVRTAFEFTTDKLGSQNAIGGGGRYDGLVETIGGPATPGVGFAFGLERLILLAKELGITASTPAPDYFIGYTDNAYAAHALRLQCALRRIGKNCEIDPQSRSVKAIFKKGDRLNARGVVLIGENEYNAQTYTLKSMASGEQQTATLDEIIALEVSD
ncbi:histidine--tRNA ligase [Chrysiogenes arsenatis]|uniref:histidine--tRNA ligase n=1 Tax=Chrysiogenes arsenatis TaxID=309797 RepID=UPI000423817C|nr:histidine--tRNA ligase [Chrysiogenes arsenatis]